MQPLDYQQIAFAGRLKEDANQAAIQKICVMYLFCWTIAPVLAVGAIWRLLAVMAFVMWYFLAKKRGFKPNAAVFRAVGFVIFVAFVDLLTLIRFKLFYKQLVRRIDLFMLAIAICLFNFYLQHPHELPDLVPYLMLMLAFFNFTTGKALLVDANIARQVVRNSEVARDALQQGIGGYALLYLQVCALPAILFWGKHLINNKKDKKQMVIAGCWLLSYLLFCFKASYSIALFCTALSFFLVLSGKKTKLKQSLLIMIAMFVLMLAAITYVDSFRSMLFDIFQGTAIERKLHDFSVMNGLQNDNDTYAQRIMREGGDSDLNFGSFDTRRNRYQISLTQLIYYPVIGGLFFDSRTGGHSAILDTFARYGWLGGGLYCCMIFAVPITLKKSVRQYPSLLTMMNATLTIILFVGILDSFPFEMTFNVVMLNAVFSFAQLKVEQQNGMRQQMVERHLV